MPGLHLQLQLCLSQCIKVGSHALSGEHFVSGQALNRPEHSILHLIHSNFLNLRLGLAPSNCLASLLFPASVFIHSKVVDWSLRLGRKVILLAMLTMLVELELSSGDFDLISVFVGSGCGDGIYIDVVELAVDLWASTFVYEG
jgi:hypothetical protein